MTYGGDKKKSRARTMVDSDGALETMPASLYRLNTVVAPLHVARPLLIMATDTDPVLYSILHLLFSFLQIHR